MTKLLILDKDGTLVKPASGAKFVQHPQDQILIDGVAEAINRYHSEGWTIAVASNQGGVAAGHKTIKDAIEEMRYCLKLIYPLLSRPQNLYLRGLLCPDFSGKTCWAVNSFSAQGDWKAYEVSEPIYGARIGYRKPQAGMIKEAIDYLNFSDLIVEDVLMVGDRPEDQQSAAAAGVQFMWADEWRVV